MDDRSDRLRLDDLEVHSFLTTDEQERMAGGSLSGFLTCGILCHAGTMILSCDSWCESGGHNPAYCTSNCETNGCASTEYGPACVSEWPNCNPGGGSGPQEEHRN